MFVFAFVFVFVCLFVCLFVCVQYFDTKGGGDVQLIGNLKSFSKPEVAHACLHTHTYVRPFVIMQCMYESCSHRWTHACMHARVSINLCTFMQVLGGIEVTISAPTISFTSWIKTTAQFRSGYLVPYSIVKSAVSGTSDASELSNYRGTVGTISTTIDIGTRSRQ